ALEQVERAINRQASDKTGVMRIILGCCWLPNKH
ncbi:MAG: hypothetical protein ACI95C_001838, partial [Pseudohongiellaceae bacterium]